MIAKEENKVKGLLNMIVVLAMIVSLQMPALATDNASAIPTRSASVQDKDIEISDETANRIATFLTSIIGDETGYGLSTVDFNSLQYGTKISIYIQEDAGLTLSESVLYPIFSNGVLCSTLLVQDDSIQIATNIAQELVSANMDHEQIALIFDNTTLWCWNGIDLISLHTYPTVDGRTSISSVSTTVELRFLQVHDKLDLSRIPTPTENFTTKLNVNFYLQEAGSSYCWACACASIGNYKTGKTTTGMQFAKHYFPNSYYSTSQAIDGAIGKLNQYYDLSYDYGGPLSISAVKSYLQSGSPIYATCSVGGSSTKNHAVVIRGVDYTNGYISIMDPEVSYYVSASMAWVEGTLTYKYVSPSSGNTHVVKYCGYPS